MCCNVWWIWSGNPIPASETNDTGLANKELEEIKALMEEHDLMIADCAFRSLREKIHLLTG